MREGWQEKKLGDVLALEYGKPLPPSERTAIGKYAVYGANGIKDRSDRFYCDRRSIIVGRKGSAGEITLTEEKFWPLDVTYFVAFDENKYDLQFLYHLLSLQDLTKLAKGVKPGINRNEVYSKIVRVPPLSEQQRIVAILDEAFAGLATAIGNTEKNLKNARELFESYLGSIFSQRANGEPKKLSDLCREMTVGHVGPMAKRYKPSGIPFLRSQNIRPFRVELDDVVYIDEGFHHELAKSQLRAGDVAIVRTGYPGTAAVIPDDLKIANCADLVIVRCGDQLDPRYVAAFFNSAYGKQLVGGNLNGAAQKHFNVTSAKGVKIALPSKLEQTRRVAEMESYRAQCLALEMRFRKKHEALDNLKQSILKKAFYGELTSPPSQAIKEAAE